MQCTFHQSDLFVFGLEVGFWLGFVPHLLLGVFVIRKQLAMNTVYFLYRVQEMLLVLAYSPEALSWQF